MRITDTLDDYEAYEYAAGRSPQTITLRLTYLRQLAHALADKPVTSTNVIRWISRHRDWSPQTRATVAGSVRSWLRWASDNLDAEVPAAASIPVAHIPVRRRYRNVEDPRVVSALIRSTPTTSLMILLARDAGLRRAEIAQIHARDLLPDDLLLVHGKGDKERVVPLTPLLADSLADRAEHYPGFLFPGPDGGHISPQSVYARIRRALNVNPHQLRHTFATVCYDTNGHNLREVQELLGHESSATTERYVGVESGRLKDSVYAASIAHAFPQQRDAS